MGGVGVQSSVFCVLFITLSYISPIFAEEFQHNLPDNVELVDPASLGFSSQLDLDNLLKNVKVLPIDTNRLPGSQEGVKTQILTVGFDKDDDINPEDFVLPTLPSKNGEDQALSQAAFESFKNFFKSKEKTKQEKPEIQSAEERSSVTGGMKKAVTRLTSRRKVIKKVRKSNKKVTSGTVPPTQASFDGETTLVDTSQIEEYKVPRPNDFTLPQDSKPKVIELGAAQIQKLLEMGKVQQRDGEGPPVIELDPEQLQELLANEDPESSNDVKIQKDSGHSRKHETATSTPAVKVSEPVSTVHPRILSKGTTSSASTSGSTTKGTTKAAGNSSTTQASTTSSPKEVVFHFSSQYDDDPYVLKNADEHKHLLVNSHPVFKPSQKIPQQFIVPTSQLPILYQQTSPAPVRLHQGSYNFPKSQGPQQHKHIKTPEFEFISAPPISYSASSQPFYTSGVASSNSHNPKSVPVAPPTYKPTPNKVVAKSPVSIPGFPNNFFKLQSTQNTFTNPLPYKVLPSSGHLSSAQSSPIGPVNQPNQPPPRTQSVPVPVPVRSNHPPKPYPQPQYIQQTAYPQSNGKSKPPNHSFQGPQPTFYQPPFTNSNRPPPPPPRKVKFPSSSNYKPVSQRPANPAQFQHITVPRGNYNAPPQFGPPLRNYRQASFQGPQHPVNAYALNNAQGPRQSSDLNSQESRNHGPPSFWSRLKYLPRYFQG